MLIIILILLAALVQTAPGQIRFFPYTETFDSVSVPSLPSGWTTTVNRSAGGDFVTTASSVHSSPNAVVSTNATIAQQLTSPRFDFSGKETDSLVFYERRSSSHTSGVLVEVSTDGGLHYNIRIGDTLKNPGTTSYTPRRMKLPAGLNNQPDVKIRWNVIGNGSGTTGTFRLDNIRVTAAAQTDAGITAIRTVPEFPGESDSVLALAAVKNFGLIPVSGFPVELYIDTNLDSLPQPEELVAGQTMRDTLAPGDTTIAVFGLNPFPRGEWLIMITTRLAGDQQPLNDLRRQLLSVGASGITVVINELMYAPNSPEPEWIELYNLSGDSVNLRSWKLSDRNTAARHVITRNDLWLHPDSYLILTSDSAQFRRVHSGDAHVITVPSLPSTFLNNTGDEVTLFDHRGATIDTLGYLPQWGGTQGTSLERIEPGESAGDPANWGSSLDSAGSTPGGHNSLTPVAYDLRIGSLTSVLSPASSVTILTASVHNAGRQPLGDFTVSFYDDKNSDSLIQEMELIGSASSAVSLNSKDSVAVNFTWSDAASGKHYVLARVSHELDMRPLNNTGGETIVLPFQSNSVVINEIMYDPPSGWAEYIEFYNRGMQAIDLTQWKCGGFTLNSITPFLPGTFLVLASDSSVFSSFPYLSDSQYNVITVRRSSLGLNNSGDTVILRDPAGSVIDAVQYVPSFHNPELERVSGRSLERINPELPGGDRRNWSTCASPRRGTPGIVNSIFTSAVPSSASLSCNPNPFSPDGDGAEDYCLITYELSTTVALVRARIYDARGRLIRTLADHDASGAHGTIIWNGLDDQQMKVPVGIYIVLLEALDAAGSELVKFKGVVVVAARL